jgi:phosphoribosylamine--glycine ligase
VKVCVVGGGGREHALAHVLARTADVVTTPGNPGIPSSVTTPPAEIDADLFVIGPEAPLVDGLADRLRSQGKLVFGPGADGARLEGSKAWMKQVLVDAGVPTARHGTFSAVEPALDFLRTMPGRYVIKTDGLASGKGVVVTDSFDEAVDDVRAKLAGESFGDAGRTVVIEEPLSGPEVSVLAVCDGTEAVALAPAQDHKRVGDGDTGPMTGGMGAYCPFDGVDVDAVLDTIVLPTLRTLTKQGIDYRGVLYAGLMLTEEGPKILEYNVRFGDPESQVVLPRYDGDLAELLAQAAGGQLRTDPRFVDDAAVCVVLCSPGYPTDVRTGQTITGVESAEATGATVFHAGTARDVEGRLVTNGGRVLNVVAMAPTTAEARTKAYAAADKIHWDGIFCRRDIGARNT